MNRANRLMLAAGVLPTTVAIVAVLAFGSLGQHQVLPPKPVTP